MSCAIFASAAPRSKTSLGATAQSGHPKASAVPMRSQTCQQLQQTGNAGLVLRKIGHTYFRVQASIPVHLPGRGETTRRQANVAILSGSPIIPVRCGFQPREVGGGLDGKTTAQRRHPYCACGPWWPMDKATAGTLLLNSASQHRGIFSMRII